MWNKLKMIFKKIKKKFVRQIKGDIIKLLRNYFKDFKTLQENRQ